MSRGGKTATLIAATALTFACSRSHSRQDRAGDDELPPLSSSAEDDRPVPAGAHAQAGANSASRAGGSPADPSLAVGANGETSLGEGYDVWIGELRSQSPVLCGFDPTSATDASSNSEGWSWPHPEGYFERVVLILRSHDHGRYYGRFAVALRRYSTPSGRIAAN